MIELKDQDYAKEDYKEQLHVFIEEEKKLFKYRNVLIALDILVLALTIIFSLNK